ncbi:hypothetical protein H8356DRAFT_1363909 [Neocallimastix lanati (nom. inval.)]|nr:hypothetical protein H8356DRAFT_1363909 [Neocallimastix sp. JGI-2020a]
MGFVLEPLRLLILFILVFTSTKFNFCRLRISAEIANCLEIRYATKELSLDRLEVTILPKLVEISGKKKKKEEERRTRKKKEEKEKEKEERRRRRGRGRGRGNQ